jgi:hypothetical protein
MFLIADSAPVQIAKVQAANWTTFLSNTITPKPAAQITGHDPMAPSIQKTRNAFYGRNVRVAMTSMLMPQGERAASDFG